MHGSVVSAEKGFERNITDINNYFKDVTYLVVWLFICTRNVTI
jgi:hypothetical protein